MVWKPKKDLQKKFVDGWTLEHEENYDSKDQKVVLRYGEAHVRIKEQF